MADEAPNETHLVPARLDRRALAKMRSKLVTPGATGKLPSAPGRAPKPVAGKAGAPADPPRSVRAKRPVRIWPFVIALALALGGMHLGMRAQGKGLFGPAASGIPDPSRLEPPRGLSLDEQARFWCYAVYDFPKLKARFKPPKGAYCDKQVARANLDRLLAEDLGTAVRNEIFAYQHARPPAAPSINPAAKR